MRATELERVIRRAQRRTYFTCCVRLMCTYVIEILRRREIKMAKSDMEKLEILLQHWVEHNREHSGEFREWAGKAKALGHTAVHDEILQAVEQMDRVNEFLLRALKRLGVNSG